MNDTGLHKISGSLNRAISSDRVWIALAMILQKA
jgi:hypothetical protein